MLDLTRKAAIGALTALTFGAGIAAATTPAAARGWGAPVAAGVIGGLALGVLAASAAPHYYAPPAAYYYPPEPAYYPVCHTESRPFYDRWGYVVGWRPVRICG